MEARQEFFAIDNSLEADPTVAHCALMQHDLIDIFRIVLYPLTLGSGQRFFSREGEKKPLTLTDASTTQTGVAVLTYQPSHSLHNRGASSSS